MIRLIGFLGFFLGQASQAGGGLPGVIIKAEEIWPLASRGGLPSSFYLTACIEEMICSAAGEEGGRVSHDLLQKMTDLFFISCHIIALREDFIEAWGEEKKLEEFYQLTEASPFVRKLHKIFITFFDTLELQNFNACKPGLGNPQKDDRDLKDIRQEIKNFIEKEVARFVSQFFHHAAQLKEPKNFQQSARIQTFKVISKALGLHHFDLEKASHRLLKRDLSERVFLERACRLIEPESRRYLFKGEVEANFTSLVNKLVFHQQGKKFSNPALSFSYLQEDGPLHDQEQEDYIEKYWEDEELREYFKKAYHNFVGAFFESHIFSRIDFEREEN